jgi:hypothetical protein
MSNVTYRYEQSYSFLKKGEKNTIREQVIDGPKGISIMFLKKKGEDFYKFYIKETEKDKYLLKEKKNDNDETEKNIDEKAVLKLLKENKLDVILTYFTKERGTYKGKKVSKRALKIS